MPEYVLKRNYALSSLAGRVVNFTKGVPVWVTPEVEKEALMIGAVPVEGPKDILDPEVVVAPELSETDRTLMIHEAFAMLEKRQLRGDFTAQGAPSAKTLDSIVGFDVQTKERDAEWTAYRKAKTEAAEQ